MTECPEGVDVEIIDYDNMEAEETQSAEIKQAHAADIDRPGATDA